jgi:hypothetical protein
MNGLPNSDLKNRIYQYLQTNCLGENHAKTGAVIAEEYKTTLRTVAEIIRQLRIAGFLIGSSKGSVNVHKDSPRRIPGYYIPQTKKETDNYLQSFKDELFDMLKTYNRQKRARIKFITEQQTKDLFPYKVSPSGQTELVFSGAR